MGREHRGKGVNIALSPMMNIGRQAQGGLYVMIYSPGSGTSFMLNPRTYHIESHSFQYYYQYPPSNSLNFGSLRSTAWPRCGQVISAVFPSVRNTCSTSFSRRLDSQRYDISSLLQLYLTMDIIGPYTQPVSRRHCSFQGSRQFEPCCKPAAYVHISLYVYFVHLSVLFSLCRLRLTTVTTYSPYTSPIIELWCDLLH
jgi:hypothetical protein